MYMYKHTYTICIANNCKRGMSIGICMYVETVNTYMYIYIHMYTI